MSYTYANRKRGEGAAPKKESAASQPSMDALRAGLAKPTQEQMGHRVDLPDAMRAKMENAFGADLSAVKLYESEAVADAGANAVAQGSNIAFAPGMLDFTSYGGQALLGHEISHVVSQQRGEVTGSGFLNDHALEARADREGAMAAAGQQIAMPTAALSTASAAPAAGPMQASKRSSKANYEYGRAVGEKDAVVKQLVNEHDATQASMIAAMKAQGFSDEEMEAQMLFQRINQSPSIANRYMEAQGGTIGSADYADEDAATTLAFKIGRGAVTQRGNQKRAARENRLTEEILASDQDYADVDTRTAALSERLRRNRR